jgi:excisionase family DNA binding protein
MSYKNYLTTAEIGKEIGKSQRRIQSLCQQGFIPSRKFGRDWLIDRSFLDVFKRSWRQSERWR